MTVMPDKGISKIRYNHLSLPSQLKMQASIEDITIDNKYRADGVKVTKKNMTITSGIAGDMTTVKTTDYLDGFQYLITTTSSPGGGGGSESMMGSARAFERQAYSLDTEPSTSLNPATLKDPDLQFFPTAEGFYDYKKDQYIYQYHDQVGNTRLSFARNSAGALEIVDVNDYYPFGMSHLKSGTAMFGQGSYKNYKYNGKELQETGMYDYGARMYMSDIGRWGVVDPLAETSRRWSTYTYAFNNPVRFIDPDGRQNQDITFGKNISQETQNKIVSDLQKETGLTLSVGDDGKLSYKETNNMGGSETARDMLKGAIDNHRTDYQVNSDNSRGTSIQTVSARGEVIDGLYGSTVTYDLNINTNQIDKFIAGTSEALNPLTMGYGISTLHEISHKYNNLEDQNSIFGLPGDNEKFINTIRKELDSSGNFTLPFGERKSYSPMEILYKGKSHNFTPFEKAPAVMQYDFNKINLKKNLFILTPKTK